MPSRKSTSHLTLPLPVSPFEFARGNLNLHIWLVRTFLRHGPFAFNPAPRVCDIKDDGDPVYRQQCNSVVNSVEETSGSAKRTSTNVRSGIQTMRWGKARSFPHPLCIRIMVPLTSRTNAVHYATQYPMGVCVRKNAARLTPPKANGSQNRTQNGRRMKERQLSTKRSTNCIAHLPGRSQSASRPAVPDRASWRGSRSPAPRA